MATSGTYTWELNRAQVKQDAFEMVGSDVNGETDAAVNESADRSLNALIKALNHTKTDVNVIDKTTFNTVGADGTYDISAETLAIDSMYVSIGVDDYPINPLSRQQYADIQDKTLAGRPTHFYFDRAASSIYLYPVPDAIYTVTYGKIRKYQDMTDDEQTFDFPASATEMLTFGLAHRLAFKRRLPIDDRLALEKQFELAKSRYNVMNHDSTKGGISPTTMVK